MNKRTRSQGQMSLLALARPDEGGWAVYQKTANGRRYVMDEQDGQFQFSPYIADALGYDYRRAAQVAALVEHGNWMRKEQE